MSEAVIRMWGANLRETLATIHAQHGPSIGAQTAAYFSGTIAAVIAEAHGRRVAVEMMYAAGDAALYGRPLESIPVTAALLLRSDGIATPVTAEAAAELDAAIAEEWAAMADDPEPDPTDVLFGWAVEAAGHLFAPLWWGAVGFFLGWAVCQ